MTTAAVAPAYVQGNLVWEDDGGTEHPIQYVKVTVFDKDPISNDVLGTVYTNADGDYFFSYTDHLDEIIDWSDRDIFIRAYAGGENTMVYQGNGWDYYYESTVTVDLAPGATCIENLTIDMTTDWGRAFQISQAVITGARYVKAMKGSDIAACSVRYPHNEDKSGCFYRPTEATIFITGQASASSSNPQSYASWDVILHEYGHHVAEQMGIEDNPGGWHSLSRNMADHYREHIDEINTADCDCTVPDLADVKSKGTRLAWGEAWPTVFGGIAQQYYIASLQNIVTVGDVEYDSYNGATMNYETTIVLKGDACEASIIGVLWDLYDGAAESYDAISLGASAWWDITTVSEAKTFSEFVNYLYEHYGTYSDLASKLGQLLTYYKMAPSNLTRTATAAEPPTFGWTGNGGSTYYPNGFFYLIFYNADGDDILHVGSVSLQTFTLSQSDWNIIVNQYGQTFSVSAAAYQTSSPVTRYISQRYTFTKPTPALQQVTFTAYANSRHIEKVANLSPGQYIDYYVTFETAGNKLFQTFGEKDTYMYLYSAAGALLYANNGYGFGDNAFFNYTVAANTQYRIRIKFYNINESGAIRLGITPASIAYQNYSAVWNSQGVHLGYGFTLTLNTVKILTFTPTESGTYRLLTSSGDNLDVYLYIVDPASSYWYIYNDNGGGNGQALITASLTAGRRYFIVVSAYDITTQSGYTHIDITKI